MAPIACHHTTWRLSTLLLFVLYSCCFCEPSVALSRRSRIDLLYHSTNAVPVLPTSPASLPPTSPAHVVADFSASSLAAKLDRDAPFVSRVSGCVDDGERTVECPAQLALELTMYGLNFQRTALTLTLTTSDTPALQLQCAPVRVSTDEQLRCQLDTTNLPLVRRRLLSVAVNSSLGDTDFPAAIEMSDQIELPTITAVSGCTDGWLQTRDCTAQSVVRLLGAHYPRWLSPSLVIGGQLDLPCEWKAEVDGVYCPLDDIRVDSLPTGQLLPIQLHFDNSRTSQPILALALRANPPSQPQLPPSSTALPPVVPVNGDELQSIELSLFVVCVVSLVALCGGVLVWCVGWWTAHRRAFVSARGQAAVDTRQVLLH